jgi:hypothetical protein
MYKATQIYYGVKNGHYGHLTTNQVNSRRPFFLEGFCVSRMWKDLRSRFCGAGPFSAERSGFLRRALEHPANSNITVSSPFGGRAHKPRSSLMN